MTLILTISAILLLSWTCGVATGRSPNDVQESFSKKETIQGLGYVVIAHDPGKIEFYWDGHRWAGRIWIDYYAKWEDLTDIRFDPRTGELQFNRPAFKAPYSGALSGNRIVGTFIYQGGNYSWEARRP